MSAIYQQYETATLKLQAIKMQLNLRAKEGNEGEVKKLLIKKEQTTAMCDDLYCRLFMLKAG